MKEKIKLITAMDLLFLLLLSLSGRGGGAISEAFYYLAFLLPVALTLGYIYNSDKSLHASGVDTKDAILNDLKEDFSVTKENISFSLPVFFPAILLTIGISTLTSLLLGAFGYSDVTYFEEPFIISLLTHALLPAILEELLFRFAPIKLLSENKKTAFLVSTLAFSFAHTNLFQIPYALFAGAVLSGLYIMTGSILPSIALHFLNNAISLISIYSFGGAWLLPTILLISLLSVLVIVIKRDAYIKKFKFCFNKSQSLEFSWHPLFFIGTSLILAVSALVS